METRFEDHQHLSWQNCKPSLLCFQIKSQKVPGQYLHRQQVLHDHRGNCLHKQTRVNDKNSKEHYNIYQWQKEAAQAKTYSKPKLEYNFLRSSLVSSVPMLQNTNRTMDNKIAWSWKIISTNYEEPSRGNYYKSIKTNLPTATVPIYGYIDSPSISLKGKQVRHDFRSGTTKFLIKNEYVTHSIRKKKSFWHVYIYIHIMVLCSYILDIAISPYLTKLVKVLKVCLVKSIPHNFNVHVIQVLQKHKSNTNLSIYIYIYWERERSQVSKESCYIIKHMDN